MIYVNTKHESPELLKKKRQQQLSDCVHHSLCWSDCLWATGLALWFWVRCPGHWCTARQWTCWAPISSTDTLVSMNTPDTTLHSPSLKQVQWLFVKRHSNPCCLHEAGAVRDVFSFYTIQFTTIWTFLYIYWDHFRSKNEKAASSSISINFPLYRDPSQPPHWDRSHRYYIFTAGNSLIHPLIHLQHCTTRKLSIQIK